MKKIALTILSLLTLSLPGQPLQYHLQRSSANIAAMSEAQSLQVYLNGQYGFVGFEGAPKNILLNVATPLSSRQRNSFYNHQRNAPTRHFVGGTINHETFGVHSNLQGILGYNYRFYVGESANITLGLAAGAKTMNSDYSKWQSETAIYDKRETTLSYQVGARFEVERLSVSLFNNNSEVSGEIVWGNLWNSAKNATSNYYEDDEEKVWHGQLATMFGYDLETGTSVIRFSANAVYRDGLGFGVSYQTEKDLAANISLRLSKKLRLGYAYQLLNINPIAPKHEIALRFWMGREED